MDERLRSNLIDSEASLLLNWAAARLTDCVNGFEDKSAAGAALRTETRRVQQIMRGINDSFDNDQTPTPQDLTTALGLTLNTDQIPPPPDRSALIQWLLDQVSAAWANPPAGS